MKKKAKQIIIVLSLNPVITMREEDWIEWKNKHNETINEETSLFEASIGN